MTISNSIHVAANGIILFFFRDWAIVNSIIFWGLAILYMWAAVLYTLAHLFIVSSLDGSPGFSGPKSRILLWTSHGRWMTGGELDESRGEAEPRHLFGGEGEDRTEGLFLIRWLDTWRDWILAQSTVIVFLPRPGTYGWVRQSFCVFPDSKTFPGNPRGYYMCDWLVPSFRHSFTEINV